MPAAWRFLEGLPARVTRSGAVRDALATLRPLKVLVVGEAIIDEYDYCVPLGKAPKDPDHLRAAREARASGGRSLRLREPPGWILQRGRPGHESRSR